MIIKFVGMGDDTAKKWSVHKESIGPLELEGRFLVPGRLLPSMLA